MNNENDIVQKLKKVLEDLEVIYSKIMLFGSRARGEFNEDSDWDFLIILKKPMDDKARKDLWYRIYQKFHQYFPYISIDLIIIDAKSFENEKNIANTISNEVYIEGIEV